MTELKIRVPRHLPKTGHPLAPYVMPRLIPDALEAVVLDDFYGFCRKLDNSPSSFLRSHNGFYIPLDGSDRIVKLAKKEYNIDVIGRLLLPTNVSYWTFIHESLHGVFDRLGEEKQQLLVKAAESYDYLDDMLALTHTNVSHFKFNVPGKKYPEEDTDYNIAYLNREDQLYCVNEFISNFFCNNRGYNRNKCITPEMKSAMRKIGYRVDNPPRLPKKDSFF